MFFKKSTAVNARREIPMTKSHAIGSKLIKEAWWLGLVLVGLYITVILFTYHNEDPSWSHMAADNAVILVGKDKRNILAVLLDDLYRKLCVRVERIIKVVLRRNVLLHLSLLICRYLFCQVIAVKDTRRHKGNSNKA